MPRPARLTKGQALAVILTLSAMIWLFGWVAIDAITRG